MNLLPLEQARAAIGARCQPKPVRPQLVAIQQALGRVAARPVLANLDVPPHDNSAMDGFAFAHADLAQRFGAGPWQPPIAKTLLAGAAAANHCPLGQCVRIMTGAVMPWGADTVIAQEWVEVRGGVAHWPADAVAPGANCRRRGEDLRAGQEVIGPGRLLRPADLGLLASLGQAKVAVRPRLRVAFFSTGNELRQPGQPLDAGCIYDSNRYTMGAMLQTMGVEARDHGMVPDDPKALNKAFAQAARDADVVITSGGVSVGEADHTKQVMRQLGSVDFWQLAIQPGRPMAFGALSNGTVLFGLPGNPVAVMVTFYALVRPALLALMGATQEQPTGFHAIAGEAISKKPGRTEFRRGVVWRSNDAQWTARTTGGMGSGILRSMSQANCLIELGPEVTHVAPGALLNVWPFDGLT
jgi:molybdopterin molybdotransferase